MALDAAAALGVGLRFAFYVSALTGIGIALAFALGGQFAKLASPRIAAACAGLSLLLQMGQLLRANAHLGGGLDAAFNPDTFGWIWAAQGSQTLVLAAGGALLVVNIWLRSRIAAGLGGLILAGSFALTGHTSALPDPGMAPIILVAHVALAAGWFVAPLVLWPRGARRRLQLRVMEAYSGFAVVVVPVVFLAGLWLSWRIAGGVEPLLTTPYGQLLLAKLLIASAALGLGALNKTIITRVLRQNPEQGRRALRMILRADAVLFLGALACVALVTTYWGPQSHSAPS